MNKHRIICIACILMLCISPTTYAASNSLVQRYSNHWSHQNLQDGVTENWMEHISDGVDIDSMISKADYLIMLEKAIGLTPGSAVSEVISSHGAEQNQMVFIDITGHPIYSQGWLKIASDFGIVISSEYQDRLFAPDGVISRREAIMMATRALGFQYPAQNYTDSAALFEDWSTIPNWAKGFANELVNFDILKGYPDGNASLDRALTYSEAAALVDRTQNEMVQGIDSNIKIVKSFDNANGETSSVNAVLPVPAQFINGVLYVPLRAIYGKNAEGMTSFAWNPALQEFQYTLDFLHYKLYAGSSQINGTDSSRNNISLVPYQLSSRIRVLKGELMVPVQTETSGSAIAPYVTLVTWDSGNKVLTVKVSMPQYIPMMS